MATEKNSREDLHVSIPPSVFICPISMEVMKSPVSLCTGVTYDRSSIEKWLSLGHSTCPATMLPLPSSPSSAAVPNLTLRRLIHLWRDVTPPSPPSLSKHQAADVIANTPLNSVGSLVKIVGFVKSSPENLKFVLRLNDAVERFIEALAKSGDNMEVCELIIESLDLISSENGVKERLNISILKRNCCLSSFISVLQKGSVESKAKSAKILELIAFDSDSQREIASKQGLLYELYRLTKVDNSFVVEAGLSALTAVSTSRPVKRELIRFGLVRTVGKILSGYDFSPAVRPVIEKALGVLELIATCTDGRSAISEDEECVFGIVKRLIKCSPVATEHGITVLWSVCCLARDTTAQEKVVKVSGLTKVLLVMQSACSANARQMCAELVKVLRAKNSKSNLAVRYESRTTHITPY